MSEETALAIPPVEAEVVQDDEPIDGPPFGPEPPPQPQGCARFYRGPSYSASLLRVVLMIFERVVTKGENVSEALAYLRLNRPNERVIRWLNSD